MTASSSLSERELEDAEEALDTEYRAAAERTLEAFLRHYSAHPEQFVPLP